VPVEDGVNYAPNQSQCYVQIPDDGLQGKTLRLVDLMGSAEYDRPADAIRSRGLYLDLPGWGYHVFEMTSRRSAEPKTEHWVGQTEGERVS